MPTYDYVCDACDHTFEHFQSITDPVLKKCPKCKKSKLRRLFGTGGAVMFKGSGFYQTDYRSESYRKAASADKPPDSKSESKSDGKSPESKSSDSKTSESKSSESKTSESKSESKSEAKSSPKTDQPRRKGRGR